MLSKCASGRGAGGELGSNRALCMERHRKKAALAAWPGWKLTTYGTTCHVNAWRVDKA